MPNHFRVRFVGEDFLDTDAPLMMSHDEEAEQIMFWLLTSIRSDTVKALERRMGLRETRDERWVRINREIENLRRWERGIREAQTEPLDEEEEALF